MKARKLFSVILALIMSIAACACAHADSDAAQLYNLGDTVEDFNIVLSDGSETTLYKLLEEKKAVLLNFWASWCGPCMNEFPYMNEAAAATPDVAVVALSVEEEDTDETVNGVKSDNGLDAIMMGRDSENMFARFDREGAIPLSAIIDRNGVLCYMEVGSQPSADAFTQLFSTFTADDYSDSVIISSGLNAQEVDVERPAAADAAKALGITDERISVVEDETDDTWPFVVTEEGLEASNGDVSGSTAHIELSVNVQAGEAIKYEYRVISDAQDIDALIAMVDSEAVHAYVDAAEWKTDYIQFSEAGEHSVDFIMSRGNDEAAQATIRNVSIISADEAEALNAQKSARPENISEPDGISIEPAEANQARAAEYIIKQSDGAEYSENVLIASTDKVTLRIRIGADINPDLALMVVNGSSSKNIILSDLPTDGEGYIYECDIAADMDDMGAVYVNACGDLSNTENYVSAQVYKDEATMETFINAIAETMKAQHFDGEISWHYTDEAN